MLFGKIKVDRFYLVKVRRWNEFEMGYKIIKGIGNFYFFFLFGVCIGE